MATAAATPEPTSFLAWADVHGLVREEDETSFESVREGLRDMGLLVTEEYSFTEVVSREKSKELLGTGIVIPFTESSFVASYDGVIHAGVDCAGITVEVSRAGAVPQLTVTVPKPEIQSVDIDPDSFVLYSEKTGVWNPFSISEYNESLKGLEKVVKDRAAEKGVLERAETHAAQIVESFVGSLLSGTEYTLEIVVK